MRWTVNIEEDMPWHRKVAHLSDAAFRLYISAICWASKNRTDGLLSPADLPYVRPGARHLERLATELVTSGLFEPVTIGGWIVHDYLDHNPSAHTRRAMDEQKSESGQLGNHRRWHVQRKIHDPDCKFCIAAA